MRSTPATLITLLEEEDAHGGLLTARLQNALRRLIAEGHIPPGDRLPSSRLLAKEAGVSRDTVESVYQQLELEGYLQRKSGSGTFAAETDHAFPLQKSGRPQASPPITTAALSARGKEIARSGGVRDHNDAHPFVILPDVDQFPAAIWKTLSNRVLSDIPPRLLYADAQGLPELRSEIARYLATHRGVTCRPEQILILNSSQQALGLIATLLLEPGDTVALENPGFHGARLGFEGVGLKLAPVSVDEEGLKTDRLREKAAGARAVYVTPSHQYPTGATLSLERRLALIHWANENGSWIIEDDYDSEFRYDSRPISAIQGLDPSGRVLYLGTFSKVLFPSLRIAYLVLPESLMPAFVAARTLIDGHTATLPQAVLARFMSEGHFTAHIRRMRDLYRGRRDAFLTAFEKHLSPFAQAQHPAGGLHIAAYLNKGLDEAETVKAAAAQNIELPTLTRLYFGRAGARKSGWLLGFAALSPHRAEAAMRRLARALKALG
ncbi:MocR-like pyridoxine biosynthesis transcription factor PdxR [Methyloligella solikamskensis]|uniref:PLP-dependent aminotransferase family protein n=1 Tax=Methyloligella solikamskensis TaxID=1177756 RepID=A0ABW3J7J1_9HYPH